MLAMLDFLLRRRVAGGGEAGGQGVARGEWDG